MPPDCGDYSTTGTCEPGCQLSHITNRNFPQPWNVAEFPDFSHNINHIRQNTVNDIPTIRRVSRTNPRRATRPERSIFSPSELLPPLTIPEFFEIIYPVVRRPGFITKMGVSTHKKKYLDGLFFVEYRHPKWLRNLALANPIVDFEEEVLRKLIPNIPYRVYSALARMIMEHTPESMLISKTWNILCQPVKYYESPMSFKLGSCRRELCDQDTCRLLHLNTTTADDIFRFETAYITDYTDEACRRRGSSTVEYCPWKASARNCTR